jgi:hypothetical protein
MRSMLFDLARTVPRSLPLFGDFSEPKARRLDLRLRKVRAVSLRGVGIALAMLMAAALPATDTSAPSAVVKAEDPSGPAFGTDDHGYAGDYAVAVTTGVPATASDVTKTDANAAGSAPVKADPPGGPTPFRPLTDF